MRLGIYGGSFDPVHYGHLLLAECCREQCALDEVWFMPAATSPHKTQQRMAAAEQRVAMLRLALDGEPGFRVSTAEIDRGGLSYTVQTLAELRANLPQAELFFLMGADAVRDLPTWREPARIAHLATLVAVHRAEAPPVDWQRLVDLLGPVAANATSRLVVEMPRIDLSSRELRSRVSAQQSIRFRMPPAVIDYIARHQLYRGGDVAPPR